MLTRILLLCLVSLCASCTSTSYTTYGPSGEKLSEFKTTANVGIATSKIAESGSQGNSSGNLLGGFGYDNDMLTEARPTAITQEPGIIFPDGTQITGTLDHSTLADVQGHWLWRNVRSIATALVFWKGLSVWETDITTGAQTDQAKIAADRSTAINASDNARAVSTAEIDANRIIETQPAP